MRLIVENILRGRMVEVDQGEMLRLHRIPQLAIQELWIILHLIFFICHNLPLIISPFGRKAGEEGRN